LSSEGGSKHLRRTGGPNASIKATEAVLIAWPLGDGEGTSLAEVGCFADVIPVAGIVEPLLAGLSTVCRAVDIFDVEWIAWVQVCDDAAAFIGTELELSELLNATLLGSCVEAGRVVAVSKAVLEGKCIAFAYVSVRMLKVPVK